MTFFLKNIDNLNKKTTSFKDDTDFNITIKYNYLNYGELGPKNLLSEYSGNILNWFETHNKNPIKDSDEPNIYETSSKNISSINYFSLDSTKSLKDFEYEFLIYSILNYYNNQLLQFPKILSFYESKMINHVGIITKPILLDDFKYKTINIGLLSDLFKQDTIDISDIINIILQISCCLEIAQNKFDFIHYNCTADNFFIYSIKKYKNPRTKKYFEFDIPNWGKIWIPGNFVCLFSNFKNSRVNIKYFKSNIKNDIIEHWMNIDSKTNPTMKYYKFWDIYTFVIDCFKNLSNKKNITGNIDKKIIFTVICKKMIKEWETFKKYGKTASLSMKSPIDLIKRFHEMGLSSLRLPSNKTVSLFNYGNNGKDKRTYLTYNNHNKTQSDKKQNNIDIEDCSWSEIRTIAKEFGLKQKGKGINKAYLKKKIKDELPFY